ncbi:MAG TPA: hypothetical protein VK083_11970 [Nocardia sp.]|uniref:hypothetical protein n=1 Tax=Nocardia sp. TaxID=1821 RepID=UPI002B4AB9DF|nr:hypothetical protein [Nocardia sp.]HLS77497.1 hypothetical protein [Nocardia sp.]
MASTSLPLATAAAVATLFASPAGAVPNDPTTPATPAPVQPGTNPGTEGTQPGTAQPEQSENESESTPTPSQPGVTTPEQEQVMPEPKKDPKLATPTQPGVTTPRVAPLPVPGQSDQPAAEEGAENPEGVEDPAAEDAESGDETDSATPGTPQQPKPQPRASTPSDTPSESDTLVQEPRWSAPRLDSAPAAPVVEMTGPHQEIGANIDGGTLLPGYVANTHHFSNEAGYVGTIGYSTPTGAGEAGASVEFVDVNTIKVTTYTGGEGLADNKGEFVIDTTQLNEAKAAVEGWIAAQPGGAAALEAAAQVKLPPLVPAGDVAPQTVNVAGVTTQWGGSFQY